MLIDPFTVVAQIVNFALLVWLLGRFLYGPVTRAMHAREARIREETEEARRLRTEAEAQGERYRAELAGFAAEREARLNEVHAEADALRHEQLREVRGEVQALRQRWSHTLGQEKQAFLQGLRLQVARGSAAVMRRALKELADDDLEDRFIERFAQRLRTLGAAERERLSAAVREDGETFHVRTAFPASDAHRATLADALAETFDVESTLHFETDPDLVAGVELRAAGLKLAWTLDGYLDELDEALRKAFEQTVGANADG